MTEQLINIKDVRVPDVRQTCGALDSLGMSIRDDGLRHPIVVWKDGTLLSGIRRHRACFLLGARWRQIPAVFVDTVEDAAKRLMIDLEDDYLALPMTWTEKCRLWEVLRRLDEPAAAKRTDAARRRGVELRRQTLTGKRDPGRVRGRDDHLLSVVSGPFGLSVSTAKRLWAIYSLAYRTPTVSPERRANALQAMRDIDAGNSSIFANYDRLISGHTSPVSRPRPAVVVESAAAAVQRAAWDRALPQMEGLVAGLVELGPPNPALTWDQVGPVRARLAAVRRDIEKMINKMKESNQS